MLVRLILVLAVFCGAGSPLIAYIIAWIVIPNEPYLLPQRTGVTTT
jgi:phage shock protein PspC (stress-responsive transcriptional regulator)